MNYKIQLTEQQLGKILDHLDSMLAMELDDPAEVLFYEEFERSIISQIPLVKESI